MNASGAIARLLGSSSTPGRVREVAVPPAARRLSTLSRVDYEDAFLIDVGPAHDRTPEQWARVILEDAPITLRGVLRSGWSALGLKRGSARSERSVLGWQVLRSTPEFRTSPSSSSAAGVARPPSRCSLRAAERRPSTSWPVPPSEAAGERPRSYGP
jgi:hypothetical protein